MKTSLSIVAILLGVCLGSASLSLTKNEHLLQIRDNVNKTNAWTYLNVVNWGLGLDGTPEEGRKSEKADGSITQLTDVWHIPMSLIQIDKKDNKTDPTLFYAPSFEEYQHPEEVRDGAYFLMACDDEQLRETQDSFNEKCYKDPKCPYQAITMIVWGTKGNMQFAKDGVMAYFCGVVKAGPGCDDFPNCPTNTVTLIKDVTVKYLTENEQGNLVQMGRFHSVMEITTLMKSYAAKTHQTFTLPDGSSTG